MLQLKAQTTYISLSFYIVLVGFQSLFADDKPFYSAQYIIFLILLLGHKTTETSVSVAFVFVHYLYLAGDHCFFGQ